MRSPGFRRALRPLAAVAGAAALAALAAVPLHGRGTRDAGWQEVRWPFARDAWPAGRAFRCGGSSCGGVQEVYVRAKRGLCANCATGVTDDAEVDGIADLDMISADFVPRAPGEHVAFNGMAGRVRGYTLRFPDGTRRAAAGLLVSRLGQCDLLAVASQGVDAGTPAARAAAGALLASAPVGRWIDAQLDGR